MKKLILIICIMQLSYANENIQSMLTIKSDLGVLETTNKFTKILQKKNMTIFNVIEHSKSAKNIDISLRDTTLVIFGNPKVGSPLMKCKQSIAIDLPQKVLIWEDKNKQTWITYNNMNYLKKKHNMQGCDKLINKVSNALNKLTAAAATK